MKLLFGKYVIGFFLSCLLLVLVFAPGITSLIVNGVLSEVKLPLFREMPSTSHAVSHSGEDVQLIGGKGDPLSCSLPWGVSPIVFRGLDEPIGLKMRQACITHDYCYRHGNATYGYSQEDCDYRLLDDALRICLFTKADDLNEWGLFSYFAKFFQMTFGNAEAAEISSNASNTALRNACITQAKKVLVGVRFGGGFGAFKQTYRLSEELGSKQGGSTYFEYDSYPQRTNEYRVYRVADAPENVSAVGKAVYSFGVRPSGMEMLIKYRNANNVTHCARYLIPGVFNRISSPPLVVKRHVGENSEDWFAFFRRQSIDDTISDYVIVSASKSSDEDWRSVFPGFKYLGTDQRDKCESYKRDENGNYLLNEKGEKIYTIETDILKSKSTQSPKENDVQNPNVVEVDPESNAAIVFIGNKKPGSSVPYNQGKAGQVFSMLGIAAFSGKKNDQLSHTFNLFSLQTHTCSEDLPFELCFVHHSLKVPTLGDMKSRPEGLSKRNGGIFQRQEPYKVRDQAHQFLRTGRNPIDCAIVNRDFREVMADQKKLGDFKKILNLENIAEFYNLETKTQEIRVEDASKLLNDKKKKYLKTLLSEVPAIFPREQKLANKHIHLTSQLDTCVKLLRYREFQSPPFVTGDAESGKPVISWLRRGIGNSGDDYNDLALLRRHGINFKDNRADVAGPVLLEGHSEANEPSFVLGRNSINQFLVSFSVGKDLDQEKRGIYFWKLPKPSYSKSIPVHPVSTDKHEINSCKNLDDPSKSNDIIVDRYWLDRPAMVVGHDDGSAEFILQRLVEAPNTIIIEKQEDAGEKDKPVDIEILQLKLSSIDNANMIECHYKMHTQLFDIVKPELNTSNERAVRGLTTVEMVSKIPLLAWTSDAENIELVVPMPDKLHWQSLPRIDK